MSVDCSPSPVDRHIVSPPVRGVLVVGGLLVAGIAGNYALEASAADLRWAAELYVPGGAGEGWPYGQRPPWSWLYEFGEIPPLVMAVGALVGYALAKLGRLNARYAAPFLVIVLTVILGPGLLVNGLLKTYWGRPRPADVAAFGGDRDYRSVSSPGIPGAGKSFTCGHCSMGFAVASGVALYPAHPAVGAGFLVTGLVYGAAMGIARMAQGGHFATDVLWSGVLTLSLIAVLYYWVFRIPERFAAERAGIRGPPGLSFTAKSALILLVFVAPALFLLLRRPIHAEISKPLPLDPQTVEVRLSVEPDWVEADWRYSAYAESPRVEIAVKGSGAPWTAIRPQVTVRRVGARVRVRCAIASSGYVNDLAAKVTVVIPQPHVDPVVVVIGERGSSAER